MTANMGGEQPQHPPAEVAISLDPTVKVIRHEAIAEHRRLDLDAGVGETIDLIGSMFHAMLAMRHRYRFEFRSSFRPSSLPEMRQVPGKRRGDAGWRATVATLKDGSVRVSRHLPQSRGGRTRGHGWRHGPLRLARIAARQEFEGLMEKDEMDLSIRQPETPVNPRHS
jgi:hypothetical protein